MLSKNSIKFIKSLQIKKFRKEYGLFLVEGRKSVLELLKSDFEIERVVSSERHLPEVQSFVKKDVLVEVTTEEIIESLGTFESNNTMIAIAKARDFEPVEISTNGITLMLDGIQDPGNLGTIVRTADWFGIEKIVCSANTVDFYNPKVISATMGSFTRVKVVYADLEKEIKKVKLRGIKIFGTVLDGTNVRDTQEPNGVIIIGNEANGISSGVFSLLDYGVTIPGFGKTESLNAAVATGIILHHFCANKI